MDQHSSRDAIARAISNLYSMPGAAQPVAALAEQEFTNYL